MEVLFWGPHHPPPNDLVYPQTKLAKSGPSLGTLSMFGPRADCSAPQARATSTNSASTFRVWAALFFRGLLKSGSQRKATRPTILRNQVWAKLLWKGGHRNPVQELNVMCPNMSSRFVRDWCLEDSERLVYSKGGGLRSSLTLCSSANPNLRAKGTSS